MLEKEGLSPATPELPLPTNLPSLHKPHLSPYGAPALPPKYGHFVISAPPLSTRLSKPSMKKSGSVPPSASLPSPHLSPVQPEPNTIPTGLAQPPLSPSISSKIDVSPKFIFQYKEL